ncbi:hypothetical protein SP41_54 [Salmonella phage 41]|nr:hypothetical protein SP41_54 [Salmonella phage 41]
MEQSTTICYEVIRNLILTKLSVCRRVVLMKAVDSLMISAEHHSLL